MKTKQNKTKQRTVVSRKEELLASLIALSKHAPWGSKVHTHNIFEHIHTIMDNFDSLLLLKKQNTAASQSQSSPPMTITAATIATTSNNNINISNNMREHGWPLAVATPGSLWRPQISAKTTSPQPSDSEVLRKNIKRLSKNINPPSYRHNLKHRIERTIRLHYVINRLNSKVPAEFRVQTSDLEPVDPLSVEKHQLDEEDLILEKLLLQGLKPNQLLDLPSQSLPSFCSRPVSSERDEQLLRSSQEVIV